MAFSRKFGGESESRRPDAVRPQTYDAVLPDGNALSRWGGLADIVTALNQSAIVALTDAEGIILDVNDKFTAISGYAREELLGRTHRIVNSGYHPPAFFQDMWRTLKAGKVWQGEIRNRAKGGSLYWMNTTITPFLGEDGLPTHYLAIRFDNSARHQVEAKLEQHIEMLAQATEAIPGNFSVYDADDRLTYANSRFLAMLPPGIRCQAKGQLFADLVEMLLRETGLEGEALEEMLRRRFALRAHPGSRTQVAVRDGNYMMVEDRKTPEGGTVVLAIDVTDTVHLTESLHEARKAAEAANAMKDHFIATVSHELRSPLQAILGHAELLLMTNPAGLPDEVIRRMTVIKASAERQAWLVDDLMDNSLLESGRMTFKPTALDLADLVGRVLGVCETVADEGQVALLPDLGPMTILADPQRLDQVLINLVSNAVKYNHAGGHVWIRARATGQGRVRLEVQDDGQGIAPDCQDQVFEPFQRLGQEQSAIRGTGLGLCLTRRLVEGMGGSIGFQSALGSGSLFWLDLPGN